MICFRIINDMKANPAFSFIKSLLIVFIFTITSCKKEEVSEENNLRSYQFNTDLFTPNENVDSVFIADPHVLKVDGTYYLYGTGYPNFALASWSSKTLINWKYEGVAWQPEPGKWNSNALWAPEVVKGDDGYYMYYTASGRIGVAFSGSPTGPFTDVYDHPLVGGGYGGVGDGVSLDPDFTSLLNFDDYAIDAHVLKASDGSLTFYASITPDFGIQTIVAWPMSDYRTLASDKPKTVLDVDLLSWELAVREGAWIVERNGVFYLFYSGSGTFDERYAVGVATANNPMGPFVRRPGNPILATKATKKMFGPGHCAVVEGKYNDLLIFYHARDVRGGVAIRKTRYLPLYFDETGNIKVPIP